MNDQPPIADNPLATNDLAADANSSDEPSPHDPAGDPPVRTPPPVEIAPMAEPPRRARGVLAWLGLSLCLALVLPALLPAWRGLEVTSTHEARAVATSLQTWQHLRQWSEVTQLSLERLEPYLNHRSQAHHAPGLVWLHMVAFHLFTDGDPTVEQAVTIARLVAAAGVVLTIAGAFWAAYAIGGQWAGPLAGLLCAANPILIRFGCLGTATAPALAMETLGIAAALWAIRPLRPPPSTERQFLGWLMCGLLTGAATYLEGPWALFDVGLAVLVLVILCPGRVSHLLGLLASLLIAALLVAPWAVYAYEHAADGLANRVAGLLTSGQSDSESVGTRVARRNLMLLIISLPWTMWVVGAVLQPFSTSSRGARIRLFLGLIWALAVATLLICRPGNSHIASAMSVAAPWAVLLALLFSHYGDLADEGRSPRTWRLLRWPHVVLMMMASAAVAIVYFSGAHLPDDLLGATWDMSATSWWMAVALAVVLFLIALFSLLRLAARDLPRRSLAVWSIWTIILCAGATLPTIIGPRSAGQLEAMVAQSQDTELVWFAPGDVDPAKTLPDARLLLHTRGRDVRVATSDQLVERYAANGDVHFFFAPVGSVFPTSLHAQAVTEDVRTGITLYRTAAAPATPSP